MERVVVGCVSYGRDDMLDIVLWYAWSKERVQGTSIPRGVTESESGILLPHFAVTDCVVHQFLPYH